MRPLVPKVRPTGSEGPADWFRRSGRLHPKAIITLIQACFLFQEGLKRVEFVHRGDETASQRRGSGSVSSSGGGGF